MDQTSPLFDWALLGALLLGALLTMVSRNGELMRAVRAQAMEATAQVESSVSWMGQYVRVLEENSELRRENIALSSQVARTRSIRMENRELKRLLNLRDSTDGRLRAARIVTKDLFRQENFLTLNVGRTDGVQKGMPVVHQDGIVGTVLLVSEDYARVMPYLNTEFRVPAAILSLRAEGIVRWDGERLDRLVLEHVVKTEPVEPGQRVVTSGHSGTFPAGRPIGTVDSVVTQPGRSELRIFLTPAVPLYEIQHAFVLLSPPDPERRELEEQPIG